MPTGIHRAFSEMTSLRPRPLRQFDYLFPYMTEKERLAFLETTLPVFPAYYSFCFQHAKQDPALIGKMYDVVLRQKGFVGRSVAATRAKIAASSDKETLSLFEKLTARRSQLAALLLSKPNDETQWRQESRPAYARSEWHRSRVAEAFPIAGRREGNAPGDLEGRAGYVEAQGSRRGTCAIPPF